MKPIYVLDTNVLLDEPNIIYSFPDAEIVISETVLSEIDKLKTTKASTDLKYHGREISRALFELSKKGKLREGIRIDNGAVIKIATFDSSGEVPKSLNLKNTDDRILALTFQIHKKNPKNLTLVTSDLNMLLKAQTLGINIQYKEGQPAKGFQFFRKTTWKKNVPWFLTIFLVLVISGGIVFYFQAYVPSKETPADISSEIMVQQKIYEDQKNEYLKALENDPNDLQALVGLGNLYFDTKQHQLAINMYQRALEIRPSDTNIKTDLGIAYFYLGMNDAAVREFQAVIEIDPNHPNAHFNMGIVLWRGKSDLNNAVKEFEKYLELRPEGPSAEEAKQNIAQINAALKKSEGESE
ncbi:MAG TPA: tetratricopeptide repeat protein [Actinobacteria bacterium]|nr:tetratricopeptide repeat protein [Actinomycetota bacterium]